ncbi:techylectin-5B-like [Portunus trituberculatus]|uniref:techylectin-5B-like n=1 Tax=Portunus trituberculatus TaxID=210409 RepID=UPI001E1D0C38|nr:techylectin-5B-like [Portunus trituberculatus]XP_045136950.1 techylectin-5B-like [Portunus trituberculatus]
MAGGTAVVVAVLGVLVAVNSQQETIPEDPTTEYYMRLLRSLLANTTYALHNALTRLQENTAQETSVRSLQESLRDVKESVGSLERSIDRVRNSVDNGVDRTRVEIRTFRNRVSGELADLRHLVEDKTGSVNHKVAEIVAGDCQDLYDLGHNASGVYHLARHGRDVLCEMEGGDGGWLVVQRRARVAEQVDFNLGWDEYKKGFGDLETEFWIGNDFLHVLTNQKTYQLRFDFHDYEDGPFYAAYSTFRVGNEESHYPLYIGDFSGNVTDAFTYHHGRSFSTKDRDNDLYSVGNCAEEFTGGWWYDRCYDAHLNGLFPVVPDRVEAKYITWWAHKGDKRVPFVLDKVTMRIKPKPV